jgi:hypothetical protein
MHKALLLVLKMFGKILGRQSVIEYQMNRIELLKNLEMSISFWNKFAMTLIFT